MGHWTPNWSPNAPKLAFNMRKIGIVIGNKTEIMAPTNPNSVSLSTGLKEDKFREANSNIKIPPFVH